MEDSPRGRQIEYVEGTPEDIISRGEAIADLGEKMLTSADTLEKVKNQAIDSGGQKGKAIDKLRESIGDSYSTLRQAGNLYKPVGPIITGYGEALETVQPLVKSAVDDCEALWSTYESLPGSVEPRGAGGLFQPEEDSPEAEKQAAEDAAKKAAYDTWEARATEFDTHYDTWEEAFDSAADGIGKEMADKIADGFWEGLGDIADVLTWVALIVGVLALIIGGPLVALALLVSVVYLLVTAVQAMHGDKSWTDVLLAAIAVVPLTKASTLTKFLHAPVKAMKGATVGQFTALKYGLTRKPTLFYKDGVLGLWRNKGPHTAMTKLLTGTEGKNAVYRSHKQLHEGKHILTRLLRNSGYVRGLSQVDWAASTFGHISGYIEKIGNFETPTPLKIVT